MKTKITEMCFAYIIPDKRSYSNEDCKALSCNCPGFDLCPFYKSFDKHRADQAAANEKLRKLPAEKQLKISAKFYHGEMPWRSDDETC